MRFCFSFKIFLQKKQVACFNLSISLQFCGMFPEFTVTMWANAKGSKINNNTLQVKALNLTKVIFKIFSILKKCWKLSLYLIVKSRKRKTRSVLSLALSLKANTTISQTNSFAGLFALDVTVCFGSLYSAICPPILSTMSSAWMYRNLIDFHCGKEMT